MQTPFGIRRSLRNCVALHGGRRTTRSGHEAGAAAISALFATPAAHRYPAGSRRTSRPPSVRYETFDGGNLFRVAVPSNWQELQGTNSVTFAPEGGYGEYRGQSVFTHGLQVGMEASTNARDLRTATTQLMQGLAQSNPSLRQAGGFSNINVAGRPGLATVLTNVSRSRAKRSGSRYHTRLTT